MGNLPARANQDIYMVNGVPISFYEIDRWYRECLKRDRALALYLGDPYNNKVAAELCAMRVFGTKVPDSTKYNNFKINLPKHPSMNSDFSWASSQAMQHIFSSLNQAQAQKNNQQSYFNKDDKTLPPVQQKKIDWKHVLQIPNDSEITPKLVKVCFRKLVRKYHPDLQGGNNEKMCIIIEARDAAYRELGFMR